MPVLGTESALHGLFCCPREDWSHPLGTPGFFRDPDPAWRLAFAGWLVG